MAIASTPPEPLILRFYTVNSGELVCRVTEPASNRSWVLRRAANLRDLIYSASPGEESTN
jgi:hypothetical protein